MDNAKNIYVVTAATGNIGTKLVERLLEKGHKVRAVARDMKKLDALAKKGAEVVSASLDDAGAIAKAFTGATAVFTLIPPDYTSSNFRGYQNKISEIFSSALQKAGVTHVVNLSSVGAHLSDKSGPIKGLCDHEQRLNKLQGVDVLHLRACYFMENLFMNLDMIRTMGIMGSPIRADFKTPMIATQDIAAAAAEHLIKLDFSGKSVHELLGQRDVTMAEVTAILAKALGRTDIKYVQFPYEDAQKAMVAMGLSNDVAGLMIEMQRNMNDGILKPTEARSSHNTTSTTIEEFAVVFAQAYRVMKENSIH